MNYEGKVSMKDDLRTRLLPISGARVVPAGQTVEFDTRTGAGNAKLEQKLMPWRNL
jgi:hypothetical protein